MPLEPSLLRVRRTSGTHVSSVPFTNWMRVSPAETESAARARRAGNRTRDARLRPRAEATRAGAARDMDMTADIVSLRDRVK